ncbi:MAG: radical SAM protein [Thermoplasmata archaeon]
MENSVVFGPVPSRRLGRSLGVNNIPDKICSYGCIYCQVGKTLKMEIERRVYYDKELIFNMVEKRLREIENRGERLDYVSFVPNGEPTLDINLGKEINMIGNLGFKVAVITNSSLIWREDVKEDLYFADLVSFKIDSVDKGNWKRINRPNKFLNLEEILDSILDFSRNYNGKLITETMLVGNFDYDIDSIGKFLKNINNLYRAYISIPIRPPAENWVKKPDENVINLSYNILTKYLGEEKVHLLTSFEGEDFSISEDPIKNLLAIMAVHPLMEGALLKYIKESNINYETIEELIKKGEIKETYFYGKKFFMRRIL